MKSWPFCAVCHDDSWGDGRLSLIIKTFYSIEREGNKHLIRDKCQTWRHDWYALYTIQTLSATRVTRFTIPVHNFFRFTRRRQFMAMYLYFVAEPDLKGKEGEPLLASAGKDPEDCWTMLASNRQRATGITQDAQKIKRDLTERGCVVHKYLVKPLAS